VVDFNLDTAKDAVFNDQNVASETDNELLVMMRTVVARKHLDDELSGYSFENVVARRMRLLRKEMELMSKFHAAVSASIAGSDS